MLALAASTAAFGQAGPSWRIPGQVQKIDFGPQSTERRVVFLDDGLAWEVKCQFFMVKHAQVSIQADLPEQGQFKIEQSNPDAQVELKNVQVREKHASADVVAKLSILSPEDVKNRVDQAVAKLREPVEKKLKPEADKLSKQQLRKWFEERELPLPRAEKKEQEENELRKAYLKARVLEEIVPDAHQALSEFAERRPVWVTAQDRAAWKRLEGRELLDLYRDLVGHEIIDDYLKRTGMSVEVTRANFRNKLSSRCNAVYCILSGKVASGRPDAAAAVRALATSEVDKLRAALSVDLLCHFYPAVDPQDPNAQWFNGQRVACRAKGVASIRLVGKLDPAQHDRVDWWILEGYHPQTIMLETARSPDFRIDPPYTNEQGARLRVVATGDKPVDYWIELRPAGQTGSGLKVVVHETPPSAERKFPF